MDGVLSFNAESTFIPIGFWKNMPVKCINHESSNYTKDATDVSCSIINSILLCTIV